MSLVTQSRIEGNVEGNSKVSFILFYKVRTYL